MSNILRSKTVWFNVISILLEIGTNLTQVLPPGTALIAVNAVNIGLRMLTTSSIFKNK
jgi:hypothetical protein